MREKKTRVTPNSKKDQRNDGLYAATHPRRHRVWAQRTVLKQLAIPDDIDGGGSVEFVRIESNIIKMSKASTGQVKAPVPWFSFSIQKVAAIKSEMLT